MPTVRSKKLFPQIQYKFTLNIFAATLSKISQFTHFTAGISLFAPAVQVVALAVRFPATGANDGAPGLPAQGPAARIPLATHVTTDDVTGVPRTVQSTYGNEVGL